MADHSSSSTNAAYFVMAHKNNDDVPSDILVQNDISHTTNETEAKTGDVTKLDGHDRPTIIHHRPSPSQNARGPPGGSTEKGENLDHGKTNPPELNHHRAGEYTRQTSNATISSRHSHDETLDPEHTLSANSRHVRFHSSSSGTSAPRHRLSWRRRSMADRVNSDLLLEAENSSELDLIDAAENEVEARKIFNNYQFGLRIWKSHVSSRPISTRSEIVQELYSDLRKPLPFKLSTTLNVSNILYIMVLGWWLALLYVIIGSLMFLTLLGRDYGWSLEFH
ncbi:cation/h+ exchanger protein 2 [Plakobranchus ocellatus]|uniref:Cation/h+ exchanger protein 2 n=1 Tax=Plakobranchus ocellatus TaxID=259542 RepID=A0AAV3YBA2_9GAST|nr:cation/h+ exchanger protein 2 [Plakobranchus ocellatus]